MCHQGQLEPGPRHGHTSAQINNFLTSDRVSELCISPQCISLHAVQQSVQCTMFNDLVFDTQAVVASKMVVLSLICAAIHICICILELNFTLCCHPWWMEPSAICADH